MVWLEQHTDVRAVGLPFLDSPIVPASYLVAYMAAIYLGTHYMKNRKAYEFKSILGAYNIAQVLLCVMILNFAYRGGFTHEYIWTCIRPDTSRSPAAMSMVYGSYYTWLLKGFELFETIFFVLRKKTSQVSVLHVYHHVITFVLTWFFARSIAGGMLSFSVVLNSVIHIIMYTYYFLALFGPQMQRKLQWFKRYITTIQIVQFLILIFNASVAARPSCGTSSWFLVPYTMHFVILLYMFVRFYMHSYASKKGQQQQQQQQQQHRPSKVASD